MNEETFPSRDSVQTPSPPVDSSSADLNVPRKREREISLEPQTPSAETDLARKDKLNAKKNRLDSTAEGPEDMLPASPPMPSAMANAAELVKSPPHEVKMHHISRRVSGIQWKNGDAAGSSSVAASSRMSPEHDPFADPLPAVSTRATTIQAAQSFDSVASLPETQETDVEIDSEPFKRRSMDSITSVGGSKRSRDDDAMSGDRDAKRKSPSEEADESAEEPPTSASASGPMAAKKSMESIRSVASVSKRQRDEDDNDANPRETKRPSPPPAKEEPKKQVTPPPKTAPTFGGFGSYASTASPFASVKGPSVFGSSAFQAGPSTPGPSTPGPSESVGTKRGFADYAGASPFASAAAKRSKSPTRASSPPPAQARTPQAHATFGASPAFGMGNKPMSLARPKSPSRSSFGSPNAGATPSAFSSYATSGSNGFGSPSPFSAFAAANKGKPAPALGSSATTGAGFGAGGASAKASSEEKENGTPTPGEADAKSETASPAPGKTEKDTGKSFGARLRAQEEKNEAEADEKVTLTEQDDLTTGEEDEETLYHVRSKLFTLDSTNNSWAERGKGVLRLNVRRDDGAGARLVMRKEAVHSLILNVPLFRGMSFALQQDPRFLRFSAIEDGRTTHYNLKVASAKVAQELLSEIRMNVPAEPLTEAV